jgi:peptide/nickel transport system ATP-binding protein
LLHSIPRLDRDVEMKIVPGNVPSLIDLPTGCLFHPRCEQKIDICDKEVPCLVNVAPGHKAGCHLLTR